MSDGLNLARHIEKTIIQNGLFGRGDSILVAVSGGADSMVLLHLLASMAKTHAWQLTVAHFNHHLRGQSSNADEKLVARTAKKLTLPFVAGRSNVREFASEHKLSIEMAARKLRHGFLALVASKRQIPKIALAHHADDQVELFFLRMLRGSGGEGLAGMKWQNPSPVDSKITLVRPLLEQPKSLLADYAEQEQVVFREDATNSHLEFQRNRIRHELLPLLTKKYQPALTRVILRQMEIAGAEAEFVTDAAKNWLQSKRRPSFGTLAESVQRRCLQLQLTHLGFDSSFQLIEQLRLAVEQPISVGAENTLVRDSVGIVSVRKSNNCTFNDEVRYARLAGRKGRIQHENVVFEWAKSPMPRGTFRAPKLKVNCERFDADKLGVDIVLRHWWPGDRFQPIGMPAPVKLQNLFTNQKISRVERHQLLVGAAADGELFWVEGLRLGERFKLDKATTYQLQWRWERLC